MNKNCLMKKIRSSIIFFFSGIVESVKLMPNLNKLLSVSEWILADAIPVNAPLQYKSIESVRTKYSLNDFITYDFPAPPGPAKNKLKKDLSVW